MMLSRLNGSSDLVLSSYCAGGRRTLRDLGDMVLVWMAKVNVKLSLLCLGWSLMT